MPGGAAVPGPTRSGLPLRSPQSGSAEDARIDLEFHEGQAESLARLEGELGTRVHVRRLHLTADVELLPDGLRVKTDAGCHRFPPSSGCYLRRWFDMCVVFGDDAVSGDRRA